MNYDELRKAYEDQRFARTLFTYILQNPYLGWNFIEESIKKLPEGPCNQLMAFCGEIVSQGKALGIAEERKRLIVQTILNAHDNGVKLATIQAITSEGEKKINSILKQHNRIR